MHELSVCLALVQQLEQIARERNAVAIDRIVLRVGPLSGIETELLRKAYPLAAAGTPAADAELVFNAADIVVRCGECGAESTVPANRLLCSVCGDFRTTLLSGDEMLLQSVELRTGQQPADDVMASAG
jgi:hydrogenase nickel incorporation protein HypA/HybF